jgi:phosphoglycolate phosphatase
MPNNSKLIVFDFDGTLADTLGALMRISNRLAPEFGYAQIDDDRFAELKYLSAWEVIKLTKVALWKLPFLIKRVKEEFPKEVQNVKLFPDAIELLNALKAKGYRLGIVSSNAESNIRALLKQNQVEHLFDQKANVVYIGDEIRDIQAARSSEVRVISVGWGFNAPLALIDKQPDLFITKPLALIDGLARFYPDRTQLAT